ncbi:MAG: beta-galactosidase, partial [Fibrella sp.]|nr:beta-galactosidase [Armatimonadota bacterium]
MTDIPRPEYPRPQFVRADWLCLNGTWEFEADYGDSGAQRGLKDRALTNKIVVPFCPESELSGVQHPDFLNAVWYRRTITIPPEWSGRNVLLHFGAVDYDATVWVNGTEVARHRGGFTPFTADLAGVVTSGEEATIVLRARDRHNEPKPMGKQANKYAPHSCLYTRTTGIWQTVWMEPVPVKSALKRPRLTPDLANGTIRLEQPITQNAPGIRLRATITDADGAVVTGETRADLDFAPRLDLVLPESRRRLWSMDDPHLYGVTIELIDADGAVIDKAESYTGLRSVAIDGKKVKINGKSVFQRLILDQGYWPQSVMTAPTDAELIADIQRSLDTGFNGARLHQKVFEERFLYHADRMGYLVWGEFGDWGCSGYGTHENHQQPGATYITQFLEALERDYSHPSLIGWCPLNETWQNTSDGLTVLDDVTRGMFLACKAMDTSRPVLDASGYSHNVSESDIYDSHDYEQDPEKFKANHAGLAEEKPFLNKGWNNNETNRIGYRGQPYFVSEFGGIWWNPAAFENKESWGYGERVKNIEEFYARFEGLFNALLDDPKMFGYCYTQLTDVYPEENGLYTFDRQPKFDNARLKAIQSRKAAI